MLRTSMSSWISRSIHHYMLPILSDVATAGAYFDMQDLLLRLTFNNICGLTFDKGPMKLFWLSASLGNYMGTVQVVDVDIGRS